MALGFFDASSRPGRPSSSTREPNCRSSGLQRSGPRRAPPRPMHLRKARVAACFDPLPTWYPHRLRQRLWVAARLTSFRSLAITQRPMAMYHSWGSQNRLAAPDPHSRTGCICTHSRQSCDEKGHRRTTTGAWVIRHGTAASRYRSVRMEGGSNGHTLWTWNAIGKRSAAHGALAPDAPEAQERLPPQPPDSANCCPPQGGAGTAGRIPTP